jgi:peptide/nickel transport system permease protein
MSGMLAYVLRRLILGTIVIVCLSVMVFLSLHLAPGDPIDLLVPPDVIGGADPEYIEQIKEQLGLNKPLYRQYLDFVGNIVTLDLGRSLRTNEPIAEDLKVRYIATIQLTIAAMFISTTLGVTIGVLSATKRDSWIDHVARSIAFAGISMPSFFLGLLLILIFAFKLDWFPTSGRGETIFSIDGLKHIFLPALTLSVASLAILVRLVRSAMLDVLRQDYVRTARAKGLREGVVIYKHALRNALIPVVTIIGLQIGAFLGGSVVVETVFAWPGVGRYLVQSILGRDFPVVQAAVLFVAATFVLVNIMVDILYGVLDPRVKYQ